MTKEKAEVRWFNVPAGIVCGCARCRTVLRTGSWAVGVIVGTHKYLIGVTPPVMCCGEEKKVFQCFDTEEEAEAFAGRVIEQLNREGTTANLKLYEAHPAVSAAIH